MIWPKVLDALSNLAWDHSWICDSCVREIHHNESCHRLWLFQSKPAANLFFSNSACVLLVKRHLIRAYRWPYQPLVRGDLNWSRIRCERLQLWWLWCLSHHKVGRPGPSIPQWLQKGSCRIQEPITYSTSLPISYYWIISYQIATIPSIFVFAVVPDICFDVLYIFLIIIIRSHVFLISCETEVVSVISR